MIENIRLQNFRSYADQAFEFADETNIIVGPNASGKTNLLEAVFFVAMGNPVRSLDETFIKRGANWARIDAVTSENQKRTIKITQENEKLKRIFEIDGTIKYRVTSDIVLPAILFEPNQLYRLTTSPEVRRSFIDELCQLIDREAYSLKKDYLRSILQRNRLLKNNQSNVKNNIFAWNVRLCELGENLFKTRQKVIEKFNKNLSQYYGLISGGDEKMQLTYQTKIDVNNYSTSLMKKLDKDLELDLLRGYTGSGPHRDDILITVDDNIIKNIASRGETRTLVLALKKCETKLVEESTGKRPILLLDDVFSELDGKRRKLLTDFISEYQSIITTTDADIIDKSYAQKTNLIKLL